MNLKQNFCIACMLVYSIISYAQLDTNYRWSWMNGTAYPDQRSFYEVQGEPSSNAWPGGRDGSATWTDKDGNLWLFSGHYWLYYPDDLWKYDVKTNRWTWIRGEINYSSTQGNAVYGSKGIASDSTTPGARAYASTWVDESGNLWLFGGRSLQQKDIFNGINNLNDLWKYTVGTNQWTWISGADSSNTPGAYGLKGSFSQYHWPGARNGSGAWIDKDGFLWLMGGLGQGGDEGSVFYGLLNDLWKYDPVTNGWAWMTGGPTPKSLPVYGNIGIGSTTNDPGGRCNFATWKATNALEGSDLWLFGGQTQGSSASNDLWVFNTFDNLWKWVKGDSILNSPGVYNSRGKPEPQNNPSARASTLSWMDNNNHLWLFGGTPGNNVAGFLNDLWKFDGINWTWIKGSSSADQRGRFSVMGIALPDIYPGARRGGAYWVDKENNLWLLGGFGYSTERLTSTKYPGSLNDLWKLVEGGPAIWTGTENSNWRNPKNWLKGSVPMPGIDMVIASPSLNGPVVNSSDTLKATKLQLQNGSSLTVENGGAVMIIK